MCNRIRINKLLEVEAEESKTEEKVEGKKRRRNSGVRQEKEKSEQLVLDPKMPPEVLMAEVDNVSHEEFQITEEVKVRARVCWYFASAWITGCFWLLS